MENEREQRSMSAMPGDRSEAQSEVSPLQESVEISLNEDSAVSGGITSGGGPIRPGRRPRGFRLNSKTLYLTYPQNDCSKERCLENIREYFGDKLLWAIVCQESHVDGNPHLHAVIKLSRKIDITSANSLDVLTGKHGNYQGCRSVKNTLKYVIKDGNYIEYGIKVEDMMKLGPGAALMKAITQGKSLNELMRDEILRSYVFTRGTKQVQEFITAYKIAHMQADPEPWEPCKQRLLGAQSNPGAVGTIAQWLVKNLFLPRQLRQKQLYLHGSPGIGKTTFLSLLRKFCRVYTIPAEEDWYDHWEDGEYDVATLDEFKSKKTCQWWNQWLDGSAMCLKAKGRQNNKVQNVPTILTSNYHPRDVYHRMAAVNDVGFRALVERLEVVEVNAEEIRFICQVMQSPVVNLSPEPAQM